MKYFVITDSTDTQVGLRLAGIEGVVVREEALARAAIQTAAADPDIAVLLITEKLAALCQDLIAPLKLTAQRPLVVGMVFYGDVASRGLTFVDSQGELRCVSINMSGKDGSILLVEEDLNRPE